MNKFQETSIKIIKVKTFNKINKFSWKILSSVHVFCTKSCRGRSFTFFLAFNMVIKTSLRQVYIFNSWTKTKGNVHWRSWLKRKAFHVLRWQGKYKGHNYMSLIFLLQEDKLVTKFTRKRHNNHTSAICILVGGFQTRSIS